RPTAVFPKEISSVNSVEDQISKHCSPTFVADDLLSKHQLPLAPDNTHPSSNPITSSDTMLNHKLKYHSASIAEQVTEKRKENRDRTDIWKNEY
ncbi:hypothetical protein HAX54_031865, partial [Datura stramonium]|nr:hypothetical protein [Datura stramonium]